MSSPDLSLLHSIFTQSKKATKWTSVDFQLDHAASCFEISPDGSSFVVGDCEGRIITLQLSEEEAFVKTDEITRHESRITDIAFNPTSDLLATCSNENKIEISSFRSELSTIGERGIRVSMNDRVRALTFMEDLANRSNIIFSGVGRQICITDCCSATTFRILKGHTGLVTAFCTWGGCMFASSSMDKTIRIWDMRVGDAVRVFDPLLKPAAIGSTSFHVDGNGRILVRGDGDGIMRAYDTSSTKQICAKRIFDKSILCVRIANSKRFMVISDEKCTLLCDLRDLCQIPRPCTVMKADEKCLSIRWHPTRASFATLSAGRLLRLWHPTTTDTTNDITNGFS
uniref:WD repeat-containing protein 47 n=1 Tax=Ascaris suum TaxID=6253 RepID=F1L3Y2_ASCSU